MNVLENHSLRLVERYVMKVLLIIFSVNEQILHIKKNLQSLGCEVKCIYSDSNFAHLKPL